MKITLIILPLLFLFGTAPFEFATAQTNVTIPGPVLTDDRSVVFENVNILSMTDDNVQYGMDLHIRGDRIVELAPTGQLDIPSSAKLILGHGNYIIPGLAEMHGHVPPMESSQHPEQYVEDVLFLYLAGGVTTVRGMLGHENQLRLKENVKNGLILGPNLYLAGPSFSGGSIHSPEQAAERVKQ